MGLTIAPSMLSALLCRLEICGGSKRHLSDNRIIGFATHDNLELSVFLAILLVHIPHGDVLLQAWAEGAAGNLSNLHSTVKHRLNTAHIEAGHKTGCNPRLFSLTYFV